VKNNKIDLPDNNKEINYINILRIIACFMVIINHTNGYILEYDSIINSTFYCITFSLCKIGVPLFLMITGCLILDKKYNYKKIIKCILRVLIPALGISLVLYIKNVGINNLDFIYFFKSILSKPYIIPFWYIYALIGVYCSLPFIQKMVKEFKKTDYLIFLLLFLVFPTFINLLNSYIDININYNFQLAFFPIIISTVICGNFISKLDITKKYLIISIITFIFSFSIMFLSMYIPYIDNGEISYILDSWNTFPVILMSISTFYIIRHIYEKIKLSYKVNKIISKVSSTTFGIYLFHYILNYRIYKITIVQKLFVFCPIIAIIVLNILVFTFCMIITYLLKKIPILKKYL